MYRASCNILYYNSAYHGTVVTNCQWFIVTTEALHYRTGQMTGMGFCSINLMYVISGIVKVLAVSVSLKRQIPTRPRLLCSSFHQEQLRTGLDTLVRSSMSECYTSSRSQRSMLQSGSSWQSFTLLTTEVSAILKTGNERYWPYVRFWLQIGFSIPVSKSFGAVLKVRSAIPF